MNCDVVPEACGREDHLLERRQRSAATDNVCKKLFERERELLIAIVVLIGFLNWNYGHYILYPFMIFSTWIHEMCHGMMAILLGGNISKLEIFSDGGGLAYTNVPYNDDRQRMYTIKRAMVASAGYTGTALIGGLLLLFRRTRRGPTVGTIALGVAVVISCILWVRNSWGLITLSLMGAALIICGWFMKAVLIGYLYAFLAAACSFNAFTTVHALYGYSGEVEVGGQMQYTDAHTVADLIGGHYYVWATLWLLFALFTSTMGLLFAVDDEATLFPSDTCGGCAGGSTTSSSGRVSGNPTLYTATVV